MNSSQQQAAAEELAGYRTKQEPLVDDEELESGSVDMARIDRVYR